MSSKRRALRQLELVPRRKKPSGRPRRTNQLPHVQRPVLAARFPLLVTVRMTPRVWNLRARRCWKHVEYAFYRAMSHSGSRICDFSVMGNHIHMLIESDDKRTLSSAMRSMGISLARRLNKLMGAQGRVVSDRYHARTLRTPNEVRRARSYVLTNHTHHYGGTGAIDLYSSASFAGLPAPQTWLLSIGWQRGVPPTKPA